LGCAENDAWDEAATTANHDILKAVSVRTEILG
jgi:hypothetical protein